MTEELKPCPFCGREPLRESAFDGTHLFVGCESCEISPGISDGGHAIALLSHWNTRPVEDALRARVAELEAFRASVPWEALRILLHQDFGTTSGAQATKIVMVWLDAHAPQETPHARR